MGKLVEEVVIKGDSKDAQKAAGDAEKSLVGSMVKSQLAVQAFNKVAALSIDLLKDGVEAAADYERTNINLQAALSGSGQEVEENSRQINLMVSELEGAALISEEVLRKSVAMATNMGVSADQTRKYTEAAIRMSNTMGGDVASSMRKMIGLQTGQIDRTLKMIPGITDLTKEQLKSGKAIDLINAAWAENLTLLSEGNYTGGVNEMTIAWENLGKALGRFVTESSEVGGALRDIAREVTGLVGVADMARGVLQGEVGLGDALSALGSDLGFGLGVGEGEGGALDALLAKFREKVAGAKGGAGGDAGKKIKKGKRRSRIGAGIGGATLGAVDVGKGIGGDAGAGGDVTEEEVIETTLAFEEELGRRVDEFRAEQAERREAIGLQAANEKIEHRRKLADDMTRVEEEEAARRLGVQRKFASISGNVMTGLATQVVDGFAAMAEGSEVSFDKIAKDFLVSQGQQLLGQGIASAFTGLMRVLLSYGYDATGYGLITQGGIMAGVGATMMAGGLAVQAPQSQSVVTQKQRSAHNQAFAGGQAGAGGGGPALPNAGQFEGGGQNTAVAGPTFVVFGELTEQQAMRLRRSMGDNEARGF